MTDQDDIITWNENFTVGMTKILNLFIINENGKFRLLKTGLNILKEIEIFFPSLCLSTYMAYLFFVYL